MAKAATNIAIYNAFDQASDREGSRPAPWSFQESEQRLKALIDKLPQRKMIEDVNIERWVNRTLRMSAERVQLEKGEENGTIGDVHQHALWHVRRASAIGGSEIGTIVKHFRGERGNFTSARNLALEKLLVLSPQRSTPEMARGVRAEPWIQRMYHEEHKVTSDEKMLGLMRGYRWDRLPQMVGTPDDIVILPDGRRKVIDYKSPSADVNADYEKNGISFDYVCQVHHYSVLAQSAGARFSGMEIASFDPRYFIIHQYEVERDPELIKEIMTSAKAFWDDHVMRGILPEDITPDALEIKDRTMYDLGMQATILKVLEGEVEVRRNELLSRVSALGSEWHDLAEGKLDMGFASFTRSRKWDEAALVELAAAAGLDVEAYTEDTGKPDKDRAVALLERLRKVTIEGGDPGPVFADLIREGVPMQKSTNLERIVADLEELGVNPTPAAGLSETFRISQKKKGPDADNVRQIRAQAIEIADALEDAIAQEGDKILNAVDDDLPDLPEMA